MLSSRGKLWKVKSQYEELSSSYCSKLINNSDLFTAILEARGLRPS